MKKKQQKGQAIIESILVMVVIVGILIAITTSLKKSDYFFKTITSPMVAFMRYHYKYADPHSSGWDETTPSRHILMNSTDTDNGKNFKVFMPKDQ